MPPGAAGALAAGIVPSSDVRLWFLGRPKLLFSETDHHVHGPCLSLDPSPHLSKLKGDTESLTTFGILKSHVQQQLFILSISSIFPIVSVWHIVQRLRVRARWPSSHRQSRLWLCLLG